MRYCLPSLHWLVFGMELKSKNQKGALSESFRLFSYTSLCLVFVASWLFILWIDHEALGGLLTAIFFYLLFDLQVVVPSLVLVVVVGTVCAHGTFSVLVGLYIYKAIICLSSWNWALICDWFVVLQSMVLLSSIQGWQTSPEIFSHLTCFFQQGEMCWHRLAQISPIDFNQSLSLHISTHLYYLHRSPLAQYLFPPISPYL